MPRIRYLYQHRVYHRHIQRYRHPVVQERRVQHLPRLVEIVLFVQRPADPLHGAPLQLPLHVARMHRLAHILQRGIAQNVHLARLRVNLHVDYVHCESVAHAAGVHRGAPHDRPARAVQPPRKIRECHSQFAIPPMPQNALVVLHIIHIHLPYARRPLNHLPPRVPRRLIASPARLECNAAAARA